MADAVVTYLLHFAFTLGAMVLFSSPFIGWFYLQHRQAIHTKRPHFNQFMELFFQSRSSNWLIFFWAACEAVFWFIIPEFLLLLLIFMRVRRKRQLLLYDIIGTVAGTIAGLWLAMPTKVLLAMPYIFPGMVSTVRDWYETLGVWALLHQPFSGVPYKVFLSEFQFTSVPIVAFVILAVIVRIGRYAIAYYLLGALYPAFHKAVQRHYGILLVAGIAVFTLMLMRVSTLYS